jgi:aldose 1-epimerase
MKRIALSISILLLILAGCKQKQETATFVEDKIWGQSGDQVVRLITMTNKNGMQVKVTNYGGTITFVAVPDKNGVVENVVLGFDSLSGYVGEHPYFGSLVGRYANRIGGARFVLNGITYKLNANDKMNSLHGGLSGFNRKVLNIDTLFSAGDSSVLMLSCKSADMEEGYPGNLTARVTYVLSGNNEIKIEYEAETDKPTVINLTNHSYFNLSGCKGNVLQHELVLLSDSITPADSTLIPTGILAPVAGTAFDFTASHKIGERISEVPGGYDLNYKLRNKAGQLVQAAEVYEPLSGRLMEVYTTEPGIQFYTGNFLNGSLTGYNGIRYQKNYGLCLESQHFPDSPNKPQFPTAVLQPGEKYKQLTIYKFSTR